MHIISQIVFSLPHIHCPIPSNRNHHILRNLEKGNVIDEVLVHPSAKAFHGRFREFTEILPGCRTMGCRDVTAVPNGDITATDTREWLYGRIFHIVCDTTFQIRAAIFL